jgi:hypothetical protein
MDNLLQKAQAALAATPSLSGCVYEVLIRGDYGAPGTFGIIKAANFEIRLKSLDALGNTLETSTGVLPASLVPTTSGTPLADLISAAMLAQQQTIDQQNASIASQTAQVASLTSTGANKDAQLASKDAAIATLTTAAAAKDAQIASLTSQLANARADKTADS